MRKVLDFLTFSIVLISVLLPSSIEKNIDNWLILVLGLLRIATMRLRYKSLLYCLILVSPLYIFDPLMLLYVLAMIFGRFDWTNYRPLFSLTALFVGVQLVLGTYLASSLSLETVEGLRLKTSFGGPNTSGLYIVSVATIVLKSTWKGKIDVSSFIALISLVLACFSLSRTITVFSLILLSVYAYPIIKRRGAILLSFLLISFPFIWNMDYSFINNLINRFNGETSYQSNIERVNRASRGWSHFLDGSTFEILKGRGLYTNQTEYLGALDFTLIPTHNTWLNILIESGLLGFLLFVMFFLFKIRYADNYFHQVSIVIMALLVMNTENIMANYYLIFLIL